MVVSRIIDRDGQPTWRVGTREFWCLVVATTLLITRVYLDHSEPIPLLPPIDPGSTTTQVTPTPITPSKIQLVHG